MNTITTTTTSSSSLDFLFHLQSAAAASLLQQPGHSIVHHRCYQLQCWDTETTQSFFHSDSESVRIPINQRRCQTRKAARCFRLDRRTTRMPTRTMILPRRKMRPSGMACLLIHCERYGIDKYTFMPNRFINTLLQYIE